MEEVEEVIQSFQKGTIKAEMLNLLSLWTKYYKNRKKRKFKGYMISYSFQYDFDVGIFLLSAILQKY